MNKKGSSFEIWVQVILFSVLFVIALGIIGTNMNNKYDTNKDLSMGVVTSDTMADLEATQASLDSATKEGQSGFSSLGIFTLTTIPRMVLTTLNMVLKFATGGWIRSVINLMNLGEYTNAVITIFQILYFLIIIFILFKIITRVQV